MEQIVKLSDREREIRVKGAIRETHGHPQLLQSQKEWHHSPPPHP